MQPTPAAVRLTLFALLSAIETDLRSNIIRQVINQPLGMDLFPGDLRARLIERHVKAGGSDLDLVSNEGLLHYLDFADHFELLHRHKESLSSDATIVLEAMTPRVQALAQIRNR